MKEKEIQGWKLVKFEYEKAADTIIGSRVNFYNNYTLTYEKNPVSLKKLEEAGVLDIWFTPIFKEDKKLPKINGYEGKLEGDYIIYGHNCAKFHKTFFNNIYGVKMNDSGKGNRIIKSIKLDSGVEITMEQIKEIVEYLNTQK